jgi:DNA mismatch endonuclease (patch repair protein)
MSDIVDRPTRHRMMAGIRGTNTKPELWVRQGLFARGFRYRLHPRELPGRPDIVLPRYRAVVLVHGCFWHRHIDCKFAYTPKSNRRFWLPKFRQNVRRDRSLMGELDRAQLRVLVVWECALRTQASRELAISAAVRWLLSQSAFREIPSQRRKRLNRQP